ncbi:MAG: helix-turn-helix transcriptional regulator, partial [Bacteroidota bacterium]
MKTHHKTSITPREQEVLHLIAYEHSTKEIASKLYVSYETASTHRKNLMSKLGAKNAAGIVRLAFERGLMSIGQVGCLLACLLMMDIEAHAQELTGLNYNYQVQAAWANIKSSESGNEEATMLFGACHDENGLLTAIITPTYQSGTTNCGTSIVCAQRTTDCETGCWFQVDSKLLNKSNVSTTSFDYEVNGWEDDGGQRCNWDSGDDDRGFSRRLRTATSLVSSAVQWSDLQRTTNSANDMISEYKVAWRYTKGTKNNPLDFGTIATGQKWHINSNRTKPTGADNNIGYTNEWTARGGPDVTYKFTIEDEAKEVSISTNSTTTNYDTYLLLYNSNGSELIAQHDDIAGSANRKSLIERVLCPGTYTVVVDGVGSPSSGDFDLTISVDPYSFSAGTISSSQTQACQGEDLATITGSAISSLNGNDPSYQWKKWDPDNSEYVNIPGATSQNLSSFGQMDDEDVFIRRYVTLCGVEERSSFHRINFRPSSISSGSISYLKDDVILDPAPPIRQDFDLEVFDALTSFNPNGPSTDASGDPGPLSYRWETSPNNSAWSTYAATSPGIVVPALNETTWFRRVAINDCGVEAATESVKITILPANGEITGKVTAPPVGLGTGIEGVEVCATPATALEGAMQECVLTNQQGEYTIDDLYFGPDELEYVVQAKLEDHGIIVPPDPNNPSDNDSTITVRLTQQNPTSAGSNFIDTSVYTLDGNIFQTFSGSQYGKMDVLVKLVNSNGITEDTISTDVNGNYSMIVPYAGVFTIRPELKTAPGVMPEEEHTFEPASREITVLDDVTDINFEDLTKTTLEVVLQGPCDLKIGSVNFKLLDEETEKGATQGIDIDFTIPKNTALRSVFVPARNYKIDVIEDSFTDSADGINAADVEAQFTNIPPFDASLTFDDTMLTVIYKAPPQIEFEGVPELLTCDNGSSFTTPILNQLEEYPDFKIKVWEGPVVNGCPQDTGFVKLINNGVERAGSFPISKGDVLDFRLIGGNPNLIPPYKQILSIKAQSLIANNPKTRDTAFIVSGSVPRGKTFFTQSPQVPLLILRDPPTDVGYSWFEQNSTLAYRFKSQAKKSSVDNSWGTLKVGADVSISNGIGAEVGYNVAGWLNVTGGTNGTTSKTSRTETDMTLSLTQRYETDRVLTGPEGDLFVTGVLNFVYSKTDELLIDSSICEVRLDTSIAISPDSISSIAALTTTAVHNRITILKDLKANDNNSNEPRGEVFWDNQIHAFESMIAENNRLKQKAIENGQGSGDFLTSGDFTGNIDYSGGSVFEREVTYDTLRSFMHEYLVEIENFSELGAGFEVMGNGVNGSSYIAVRTEQTPIDPAEAHKNTDTITQVSVTTGFHLEDNEANDNFLIGVYKDETYGTPVFDLLGANTSCPYEVWDPEDPRGMTDPFEVTPDPGFPVQRVGIDPDNGVQYKFTIKNSGLFKAGYLVEPDLAYNENGAIIRVNGSNEDGIVIDSLDPGQTITVGFTVRQDPAVQFFNHTIRMNVFAYCSYNFQPIRDNTNKKHLDFSVTFDSDCSRIDVITPTAMQVANLDNEGILKVQMRNYDKQKLNRFFLQHKPTGSQIWTSSTTFDFPASELFDDAAGTIKDWILPATIEDGVYDMRITTTCDGGLASGSEILQIVIDQSRPEVFGIPSPIDDTFEIDEDDQISASYTEAVKPAGITATIKDMILGDTIETVQVTVFENQVIVTPS